MFHKDESVCFLSDPIYGFHVFQRLSCRKIRITRQLLMKMLEFSIQIPEYYYNHKTSCFVDYTCASASNSLLSNNLSYYKATIHSIPQSLFSLNEAWLLWKMTMWLCDKGLQYMCRRSYQKNQTISLGLPFPNLSVSHRNVKFITYTYELSESSLAFK